MQNLAPRYKVRVNEVSELPSSPREGQLELLDDNLYLYCESNIDPGNKYWKKLTNDKTNTYVSSKIMNNELYDGTILIENNFDVLYLYFDMTIIDMPRVNWKGATLSFQLNYDTSYFSYASQYDILWNKYRYQHSDGVWCANVSSDGDRFSSHVEMVCTPGQYRHAITQGSVLGTELVHCSGSSIWKNTVDSITSIQLYSNYSDIYVTGKIFIYGFEEK